MPKSKAKPQWKIPDVCDDPALLRERVAHLEDLLEIVHVVWHKAPTSLFALIDRAPVAVLDYILCDHVSESERGAAARWLEEGFELCARERAEGKQRSVCR